MPDHYHNAKRDLETARHLEERGHGRTVSVDFAVAEGIIAVAKELREIRGVLEAQAELREIRGAIEEQARATLNVGEVLEHYLSK